MTRAGAGLEGVRRSASSIADVDGQNGPDLLITGQDANRNPTTTLYLQQSDGSFQPATAGLTGVRRSASSIADVDGRNGPDLLITGQDANEGRTATLYLQQSDGSFQPAGAGLTGVAGGSTSIADVDGQNGPDLLITGDDDSFSPTATLYLQQPDGSFQPASAGLTGVANSSTSITDVDGQNGPDLLITGRDENGNSSATLYLQQSDGSFQPAGANLAGVSFGSTSIAEVDGQNGPDLLITGRDENRNPTTTLYLQQPDGSFQPAGAGLTGVRRGASTSIADVDGQAGPDLLVTGRDESFAPSATLYLQQSDGSFQPAGAGLTGASLGSGSIADVDGDGDLDLLITGSSFLFTGFGDPAPSTRLYVNRANQTAPNQSPRLVQQEQTASRVAAGTAFQSRVEFGDPDGDKLTLRLTKEPSVGTVGFTDGGNGVGEVEFTPDRSQLGQTVGFTVEATDGSGGAASISFQVEVPETVAARQVGLTDVRTGAASIADVDGDGALDLLITGQNENGNPTATLYLQQPDGSFQPAGAGLAGVFDGSNSIADVDGQNGPDLLITGDDESFSPTATLYLQQPDGSFQPAGASLTGVEQEASTSIADVDGQNGPDLLINGFDKNRNRTATLYLQQPDGSFQPAGAGLTGVLFGSTSIADVDGQNGPDLLIAGEDDSFSRTATLYLQQPDGSFQPAGVGLTGVGEGPSTSIADVDGQNGPDLLITGRDESGNASATLYLQQPDGSFQPASAGLAGVTFGSTSIEDINGDGALDLLITGSDASTLYLQQPDGSFQPVDAGLIGVDGGSAATGDADGDGDSDLLITGGSSLPIGPERRGTATLYDNLLDPAEAAAQTVVSGGGPVSFGQTGLTVDFASGTSGEGPVRAVKFGQAPSQRPGLPSGRNVSDYRFVVEAGQDLSIGSGTELRFDVSMLGGTPSPGDIQVYRRDPPGQQRFDLLPSSSAFSEVSGVSYDSGAGELVVPVDGFSEFVFTSDSNPLPVELASFEATRTKTSGSQEAVRLTWKTASEQRNAGFEIQRRVEGSSPGGPWKQVGFRESKAPGGTATEATTYRFVDEELPYAADTIAYRLRQVDTDGSAQVTDPVHVARSGVSELELKETYPNPASRQVTVRFAIPENSALTSAPGAGGEATLRLYDVLGREVQSVRAGAEPGRHETQLSVQDLASGVYVLRLKAGEAWQTRRFTVVR